MRPEVRVIFDSSDIPGGAQTILGPAGCGPDVATVDEVPVPVLGLIDVRVTLAEDDERVPVLFELLRRHGVAWSEFHEDRHTDAELDSARLLLMWPNGECEIDGGIWRGTTYDLSEACPACGTPARQTSPMFMDGEDMPKLEGHRAGGTFVEVPCVDERLAEELEASGATGLYFRSVYAVMEDGRQVKLRWKQLCAKRSLPPMSPLTTGLVRVGDCKVCMRNGYRLTRNAPTRIVYHASDLKGVDDVNMTWEHYYEAALKPNMRDTHLSYPYILVTPKVMRIFRAAGVSEFDWIPIRVVEDA
jgi:hypothetical protein